MLKYLVILLDDTSTSYCHYENEKNERKLIALENLRAGIFFAMKENLMIQFVYPDYELPQEYKDVINAIDHIKIIPYGINEVGDVVVLNHWSDVQNGALDKNLTYVFRTTKDKLFANINLLGCLVKCVARLNVVITDVDSFTDNDFNEYKKCLEKLSDYIKELYVSGKTPQLNLLTDRMVLDEMNNCNAGWENVTLAPDGRFYVCPAFYLANDDEDYGLGKSKFSIGDLEKGLNIKNPQLYKLTHAPLCRNCDAYQCKRCVWLNRKMTYEMNTPSREQCVMAHLERNTSCELLRNIRRNGEFLPEKEIKEITYLDPFDVRKEW